MKLQNLLFLLLVPALFIFSCKKNSPGKPITPHGVDVYVAGTTDYGGHTAATFWKNGKATILDTTANSTWAVGIVVVGKDVYVAGWAQNPNYELWAVYWKNGVEYNLADPTVGAASYANSITVQGTDVYISGTTQKSGTALGAQSIPTIWKNGVASTLTNAPVSVTGGAITFNGSDMYVSAQADASYSPPSVIAEYFKNGVQASIQLPGYSFSSITSIAIQDTDVYLAGSGERNNIQLPVYWKNGVVTSLALDSGFNEGTATDITFHGTDMYITGNSFANNETTSAATLWKNGVPTELANSSASSLANEIVFQGTDVYVAGSDLKGAAAYWKNGILVEFPKQPGSVNTATGIVVVPY